MKKILSIVTLFILTLIISESEPSKTYADAVPAIDLSSLGSSSGPCM